MNFELNFRYVPTETQISDVHNAVRAAATTICDASDGQVRFGQVTLTGGAQLEWYAAVWLLPQTGRSGSSNNEIKGGNCEHS